MLHIQGLRWVRRSFGLLLAIACALVPALPLGGYLAQPPLPFAAMWLAYGWAADGGGGWRAPVIIMALGLLQDWLSGRAARLVAHGIHARHHDIAVLLGDIQGRRGRGPGRA